MALLTEGEIYRLEREARKIKRTEGVKYTEALDRVAIHEGYRNWRDLQYRNAVGYFIGEE